MALASNFSDGSTVYQVRDADTRSALVELCAVLVRDAGVITIAQVPSNIRTEVSEVIG